MLFAMVEADPDLAEPLVEGLPYLRAEAVYAARHEMAATLDDVLSRRTRARLLAAEASVGRRRRRGRPGRPRAGLVPRTTARPRSRPTGPRSTAELTAAGLHDPVPAS